ncbi:hypothetical protein [Knoellia koreensis]|uniref:Uncharacterized protein n=1 Tax=Knoellia koreensis TaxID=2730921 RepID=A0A849H9H5_9MICO|nr:hypothetical protein [Knoellia sp. DB2414S]NNM44585.1 hypothetical protein [Knoellia sp. DB2414S]
MVTQHVSVQPELPALDDWWADGALRAIEALAAAGVIFSADDLRDDPYNLPAPHHPSQWGAVFAKAKQAGLIKPVGYAASRTGSRNGGVLRLWRGTKGTAAAA